METTKSITKKDKHNTKQITYRRKLNFYRTCMEESWRRKWKVVRKWNVIVWKGIIFLFSASWHHSTLLQTHWASVSLKRCPVWFVFVYVLTACVSVTRDTVRHPRRFVFGNLFVNRIVHDPRRSWTEVWLYFPERYFNVNYILSSLRRVDVFPEVSPLNVCVRFLGFYPVDEV